MEYQILQFVGPFEPGRILADGDFPAGTDFDRLIRLNAIQPVPGQVAPDPPRVADLRRQLAAAQAELKSARAKIAEFEAVAASGPLPPFGS